MLFARLVGHDTYVLYPAPQWTVKAREEGYNLKYKYSSIHITRHGTARHDTTQQELVLSYGFDILEFTLAGQRQVTTKTKTVSFEMKDKYILHVC